MAPMTFPWDLEEEILSRLPARSLVRFRSVCKHWNALFNEKRFVDKHLARARPEFIFLTETKKIYSIEVYMGGTIEVRELPYIFPCEAMRMKYTTITVCDGLLFREFWHQGVAVWNPWLTQVKWIEYEDKDFNFCGVGYDNSKPEKGYKILGYFTYFRKVSDSCQEGYDRFVVYECASQAFKFIDVDSFKHCPHMDPLSLNGNLYWVAHSPDTQDIFIRSFDFSREIFKPFCLVPCQEDYYHSNVVLAVFKGDRFSLLRQGYETRKIEIWVTKMKIDGEEQVVWVKFLTFPTTNLPKLVNKIYGISYFIFDKTLIMCCGDETATACIYIVSVHVFKKIQIGSGFARFSQCLYLPNLVSVPLEFRSHQV